MTDWSKKWDKREKDYDKKAGEPEFALSNMKVMILIGLILFGGVFFYAYIIIPTFYVETHHPQSCNPIYSEDVKVYMTVNYCDP